MTCSRAPYPPEMPAHERDNLAWPLLCALVIHGLAALTLRAAAPTEAARVQRAEKSSELDVTLEPAIERRAPPAPASSERSVRLEGPEPERYASGKVAAVDSEAPNSAPTPPLEPASPVDPGAARPAPLGPERLGIGGSNPLLGRPDTAGETRAHSPSVAPGVERSIASELAQRDARIGYGPQGPILRELERLTQSAAMPDNTSALFVAAIDGSGRLAELSVLEATAGFSAWHDIAEQTKRSLRKKKLAVASGARGMKLRIKVSSRIQLPSGADPGLELSVLGIPLKRGAGKRSSRLALLEPIFNLEMIDVPDPGGSGKTLKLPSATIMIVPFSGMGDLSDLGASPRRLVHAHVVDQELL